MHAKRNGARLLAVLALAGWASGARCAVIANFESGLPPGWMSSGGAWTVGGAAGNSVLISPPEGGNFARSGAPGINEGAVGTLMSSTLSVDFESIQWWAAGWSGQFGNGLNRFEVLNAGHQVLATVAAPLGDVWSLQSVNLLSIGLAPGQTFYFRAVDDNSNGDGRGYAWLAMDDLKFAGAPTPVPEPTTGLLMALGVSALLVGRRRVLSDPRRPFP